MAAVQVDDKDHDKTTRKEQRIIYNCTKEVRNVLLYTSLYCLYLLFVSSILYATNCCIHGTYSYVPDTVQNQFITISYLYDFGIYLRISIIASIPRIVTAVLYQQWSGKIGGGVSRLIHGVLPSSYYLEDYLPCASGLSAVKRHR